MQATDPICGMKVDTSTELHTDFRGKTYYFCSKEDQDTFLKNPEKYTDMGAEHSHSHHCC